MSEQKRLMKRVWKVGLIGVVIGLLGGLGFTWHEFSQATEIMSHDLEMLTTARPNVHVPPETLTFTAKAVPIEFEYNFGTMDFGEESIYTFKVKNEGVIPLEMEFFRVSCGRCLKCDFKSAVVEPGEIEDVEVWFGLKKPVKRFFEYVEIRTNDPDNELMMLRITGQVRRSVTASVPRVALGQLKTDGETVGELTLFAYKHNELELVDFKTRDAEKKPFFTLETEPIEKSEIKDDKALCAKRLLIKAKPGLPLGPFTETLTLMLDSDIETELDIQVSGRVVSDISLVGGPDFSRKNYVLYLGTVPQKEGRKKRIQILVKGPHREDVKLKVVSVEPSGGSLVASIGEPKKAGAVYMHPLNIEVPVGAPPISRIKANHAGKIVLETTHPTTKKIPLFVRYAVQD